MPNHNTSICLEWGGYEGCMAVKACNTKVHVPRVWQQTYMLPRGGDLGGGGPSS